MASGSPVYSNTGWRLPAVGGYYNNTAADCGLFFFNGSFNSSSAYSNFGARLLYVRAGALQRRYRAVLPVHLQVAHRRVIDDRSLHGDVLPSRFAAIIAHFPAECTADRPTI